MKKSIYLTTVLFLLLTIQTFGQFSASNLLNATKSEIINILGTPDNYTKNGFIYYYDFNDIDNNTVVAAGYNFYGDTCVQTIETLKYSSLKKAKEYMKELASVCQVLSSSNFKIIAATGNYQVILYIAPGAKGSYLLHISISEINN